MVKLILAKLILAKRALIVVRYDLHFTALTVAYALSSDAIPSVQVEVDHPAVRGRHGFQGNAATRLRHAVGHAVRHFPERIFPALTILFNIEGHPDIFLVELLAHDALNDELQGLKRIPAPADQET